jgi:Reverse transcriptase (RNA-dependent DNA polymerase)
LSCTLFNLYTSYLAIILNKLSPTAKPLQPRPNAVFYADDIMLIANSHHDMQILLGRLRHHCADLQLNIDFDKTNIIAMHDITDEKFATFGMGGNRKHLSSKAMYLGAPISRHCNPIDIYKHRLDVARKRLASTCMSITMAGIKYLPHVKTLFNAFVSQPLLYACEVWGPTLLHSGDFNILTNDMQKLTKEFFTRIYGLPSGTPHSTMLLEFGMEPVALTIAKRVNKFLSKLSPLIMPPHTADALSRSLLDGTCIAHTWQKVLADRLGIAQFTIQQLPPENELVNAVQSRLSFLFSPHAHDDIRSDDKCKNRIISSYVQLLWNKKFGCHHPIYDVMGLPYDVYMDVVRFRTLNIPAMVYTIPRLKRATPYSRRLCPFGCKQPADLEHIMLHCHKTKLAHVGQQTTILSIFDDHDTDYLHNLAYMIHAIMDTLRQSSIDRATSSPTAPPIIDANVGTSINDDTKFAQDGQL